MAQTDSILDKRRKKPYAPTPAATEGGPGIGFNELRQACEISALREDLTRLSEDAEALCDHIEASVEQVRERVARLTVEELADPDVMAPLLQFAVGTLVVIRDRARDVDPRIGLAGDGERPEWIAAALDPPPPETTACEAPQPEAQKAETRRRETRQQEAQRPETQRPETQRPETQRPETPARGSSAPPAPTRSPEPPAPTRREPESRRPPAVETVSPAAESVAPPAAHRVAERPPPLSAVPVHAPPPRRELSLSPPAGSWLTPTHDEKAPVRVPPAPVRAAPPAAAVHPPARPADGKRSGGPVDWLSPAKR